MWKKGQTLETLQIGLDLRKWENGTRQPSDRSAISRLEGQRNGDIMNRKKEGVEVFSLGKVFCVHGKNMEIHF